MRQSIFRLITALLAFIVGVIAAATVPVLRTHLLPRTSNAPVTNPPNQWGSDLPNSANTSGTETSVTRVEREATGVLYSHDSGSGAGGYELQTSEGSLWLNYVKRPLSYEERGFKGTRRGYENGAIWRVRYHTEGNFNYLDRVTFTGSFEPSIRAADQLVNQYYALLLKRKYREVYTKFSSSLRDRQSYDSFVREFHGYELLESELNRLESEEGPIWRLWRPNRIVEHSPQRVIVLSAMNWFTRSADRFGSRFEIIRVSGSWRIDDIRSITDDEYFAPSY